MKEKAKIVLFERIERCIYLIRGLKVMLDRDLATLYGIPTKALKQAVRRNVERFPEDFMFVLALDEFETLRSQIVTSKTDPRGGTQYAPMAFTEQGVAMLSSVLNSRQAIEVNIAIMRAFVRLRAFFASQAKLAKRLRRLEQEVASHGKAIGTLFDAMQQLTSERPPAIGFQYVGGEDGESGGGKSVRENRVRYRVARKRRTRGQA